MIKPYLLYVMIILFLIATVAYVIERMKSPIINTVTKTNTVYHTDTTYVTKYITVTNVKSKIDTVIINGQQQLIAQSDTTIMQDSNIVKVSYYFPPANYFDIGLHLHNTIIKEYDTTYITTTNTITAKKSFWSGFNYSLQIGGGIGIINKQPDIYYGIGISVIILKTLFGD